MKYSAKLKIKDEMYPLEIKIKKNIKLLALCYFLTFPVVISLLFLAGSSSFAEMFTLLITLLFLFIYIKKYHLLLSALYNDLENTEKTIKHLKAVLIFNPFSAEINNMLGENYALRDQWQKAISYFHRAIRFNHSFAVAYANLGMAYQETGQTAKALQAFLKAVNLEPYLTDAISGIGLIYTETGEYDKALEYLDKGYQLRRGQSFGENSKKTALTGLHKLKHDIWQFSYLMQQGKLPASFSEETEKYQQTYDLISKKHPEKFLVELPDTGITTYDKNIYFEAFTDFKKPAVNAGQNAVKIQQDYFSTFSGLAWFDDFLTPVTLECLRSFCLNSTIWHDYNKRRGYIGSYLDDGFYSPLLFRIATELKEMLPEIFGSLPLTYMWAYKYHSGSKGFKVHADRATINVNFWLTPDSACLTPESSGMIIYEKLPPPDWNFDDFNMKTSIIRQYLEEHKSNTIQVPYRQNRIVIFDSRLFHETGDFVFQDGYENMRLNVTFLFGNKPKPY